MATSLYISLSWNDVTVAADIAIEEGILFYEDGDKSMVPEAKKLDECYCDCRHACRKLLRNLVSWFFDVLSYRGIKPTAAEHTLYHRQIRACRNE